MSNKLIKRVGSIALATAMTVTMLPTGSLSFTSTNVDVDAMQVVATQGSGVNLPLKRAVSASGGYNKQYNSSFDQSNKYDGDDLGCVYTKDATTFKVWSPTASKVVLCRYTTGSDTETGAKKIEEVDMTKSGAVWATTIKGDIVNTYYTFKVTNNGNTTETADIYAKAVGVNGKRAMVVDLDSTDPANWDKNYKREAQNLSDMVTWEVHVNDFSYMGSKAGFSDKYKGKYLAFTEDGTKLSGTDYDTGIAYLKKLGITHVQIMPMYDYGSVDETQQIKDDNYNWGYDPANFNAPEGSYSTNPYDGNVRINEMKQMIQALHDAGIKVIMDVVYNHTYNPDKKKDYMTFSPYDNFVPNYYYRTNSNGVQTDGSGCGNEVRTEAYMANKFIRESMLYWADEYNLDGFRLDLMGLYDNQIIKDIRYDMDETFGKDTMLIYGEGWTGDGSQENTYAGKWCAQELASTNIGFFNDTSQTCLHGASNAWSIGQTGLLQQNLDGVVSSFDSEKYPLGIFGMIQGAAGKSTGQWGHWRAYFAGNSNQTVTYDSCHDNKTLWDKLSETVTSEEMCVKLNMMDGAMILTSHGGNFLHSGEEFCRTKNGVANSYSSGTDVNMLDWSRVKSYSQCVEYFEGMIGVRQVFSGFRTNYTAKESEIPENDKNGGFRTVGNSNLTNIDNFTNCSDSNIHSIGYYLSNRVSGEWNQVAVLINNDNADKTATLSALDGSTAWVLVSNGSKASVKGVETVNSNSLKVPAKSVVVAVPKKTFDENPDVEKKTQVNIVAEKIKMKENSNNNGNSVATIKPVITEQPKITPFLKETGSSENNATSEPIGSETPIVISTVVPIMTPSVEDENDTLLKKIDDFEKSIPVLKVTSKLSCFKIEYSSLCDTVPNSYTLSYSFNKKKGFKQITSLSSDKNNYLWECEKARKNGSTVYFKLTSNLEINNQKYTSKSSKIVSCCLLDVVKDAKISSKNTTSKFTWKKVSKAHGYIFSLTFKNKNNKRVTKTFKLKGKKNNKIVISDKRILKLYGKALGWGYIIYDKATVKAYYKDKSGITYSKKCYVTC